MALFNLTGNLTQKDKMVLIKKGLKTYASYGYTTAQDARATSDNIKGYIKASMDNILFMDIVAYADCI